MRPEEIRRDLLAAVGERRREIAQAILTRIHTIGTSAGAGDPDYLEGLRAAVETAIEHAIEASAGADDRVLPVPAPVLKQARLAARRRTPLETVLRRYLAGHALLGDFIAEQAERQHVPSGVLRQILRSQALASDRVLAAISLTYAEEDRSTRPLSLEQRRVERVRRLLAGELLDLGGLDYDLDRWHVGLVARGSNGGDLFASLGADLNASKMMVADEDGLFWAWIGLRERPEPDRIAAALPSDLPFRTWVGIGEPGRGQCGWRITHEQARAALLVATRGTERIIRYADVAILASALKDELLTTSLRALYIDPLEEDRATGAILRNTLHAYFAADGNVTSTAAALGVARNTVTNRLRVVEGKIGHLRPWRAAAVALALRLENPDAP
jgi:PucR C-terminal helix-turn-helix domain/GGDEF-like domain